MDIEFGSYYDTSTGKYSDCDYTIIKESNDEDSTYKKKNKKKIKLFDKKEKAKK